MLRSVEIKCFLIMARLCLVCLDSVLRQRSALCPVAHPRIGHIREYAPPPPGNHCMQTI